ncbi:MAG: VPLPA-CTERM sorting domain-containing protein [Pseudomonadota bacterium]
MYKSGIAVAATLACLAGAGHTATITIDTFNDSQGPVQASGGSTTVDISTTAQAIGGTRTLSVTNAGGIGLTQGEVIMAAGGIFAFSNDALSTGSSTLSYSLGGFDLSDGGTNDTLLANVLGIDLGMIVSATVDGVTSSQTVASTGNLEFAFTDFSGVDFTNVGTFSLTFDANGLNAVDATIDLIGAVGMDPSPIPLPAGGVLLLTALAGVGALRRRAR